MLRSCNLLVLLGAFCFAIRTGQGTLELWLETGEKRQINKEVILEHGRQLVGKTTIALSSCQEAVLFHWQSQKQAFYEISEETSDELSYVATTIPRAGLVPYLLNTFLLYTKCSAVNKGDSGRAKLVLNLFAVENGRLGENLTTVEMIFLKDCGSFCRGQDADDDGRRHQGIPHRCKLCLNGGTCTGRNSKDTPCNCTEGFSGMFCETSVCEPPCQNGGRCFRPGKCLCKSGFHGPLCQEEGVPVCSSECKNGGKCSKSGECSCPKGLGGPTCETRTLEFVEDPSNVKLYCHRTATFKCAAKGTPTPNIQWYRSGSRINTTDNPRFKIVQHEGDIASSTLFLYGVKANDFGYYTCVATNKVASIHRDAYLVVLGGCQEDAEEGSNGWGSERSDWWTGERSHSPKDGEGDRKRRMTESEAEEEHRSTAEESNLSPG